jgi:hypothetical protein
MAMKESWRSASTRREEGVDDMGARIERLTGAQARGLASIRDEWLSLDASTDPADRDEAEFGIAEAYDAVGLPTPRTIVWADDLAIGAVIAAVAAASFLPAPTNRMANGLWAKSKVEALRRVDGRVWHAVREGVRFPEPARVETSMSLAAEGLASATRSGNRFERRFVVPPDPARDPWGARHLWSHGRLDYRTRGVRVLTDAVGAGIQDLPGWRRPSVPSAAGVSTALNWAFGKLAHKESLACYDALARVTGTEFDALTGQVRVARSAGWWWPLQDVAVVCERPSVRALDAQGRLHSETGPALGYRDGFSAYFWHGRLVPRWVVSGPTVERIADEPNIEVRRCAIESLGWADFTEEAGLVRVDEAVDPGNSGQILSLHAVPGKVWGTPVGVLICTNGSVDLDGGRHTFGLLVPPTIRTALGAAAWGYGLTEDEYSHLQRRA